MTIATEPASHEVIGACPHDCPDTCSMVTTVRAGVAIKVHGNPAHPQTGGALCAKVARYPERTYHPDRVLQPMRRVGPKGAGQFEPVSWDVALDDIAARLGDLATRGLQQAVLPYSYAGTMGYVQGEAMAMRFFNRLGASQLERTVCSTAGGQGLVYTLGGKVGMRVENFVDSRLILIWGSNSIGSNLHFWRYAQEAKRRGARLVCIDPRRTETADKCHEHIALLPGTDAALALALMQQLITHDWLDHDYLRAHTLGWEDLRARALEWPPERAAAVCGIEAAQITALAQAYGETARAGQPVAIRLNYGMQRVRGGGNAVRLVAMLPCLIGAWRHPAGGLLLSTSGSFRAARRDALLQRPDLLGPRRPRTVNMSTIGDALLHPGGGDFGPQVQAVVVYNSNPVAVAPENGKVSRGFAREGLFTVVLEHFLTDTADHADIVLPATTQLEHWDAHTTYGHTYAMLNRPAVPPVGQARSNAEIFRALAARMGYTEPCFADSDEAMAMQAFDPEHVDLAELQARGWSRLKLPEAPFAEGGFATLSGKVVVDAPGLGVPDYVPNYESAASAPELAARYPLAMISPPARHFMNSTFANVDSLRAVEREPRLEMHPEDAAARGIAQGATVRVFNDRGEYLCKADLNGAARPGVVNGLGIWWRKMGLAGTNVNELTHQRLTDIGRAPAFYDCLVEVEPC